jgi:hypothetical protein
LLNHLQNHQIHIRKWVFGALRATLKIASKFLFATHESNSTNFFCVHHLNYRVNCTVSHPRRLPTPAPT